ncbi:MAG: prepilin-type N-terminal cleavage/methylation domain-containing protein [Candidatus Omnitrophica bacterium]|nr:prepilin-type N-terminal cleavage/methylation domain-containing protein [Candidatus Omnitrophota bacterium]
MLRYRQLLRELLNKKGFSLVEILVSAALLLLVIAGLAILLTEQYFSDAISGAKLEAQQEVRRAMLMITEDLRQGSRSHIDVNVSGAISPLSSYAGTRVTFTDPQIEEFLAYNLATTQREWSAWTIDYTYDAANRRIARTNTSSGQVRYYNNIDSVGYSFDGLNFTVTVTINGSTQARSGIAPAVDLQEEVFLRNE